MSSEPDRASQIGFDRKRFQPGIGDQVAATEDLIHGDTSGAGFCAISRT
jgi:hypothetical protein